MIGAAIAGRLAADGSAVVVAFHQGEEAANRTVDGIRKNGGNAISVQCDMRSPGAVDALFQCAENSFESVSILVNNAGVTRDESVMSGTFEAWRVVLDINLDACFHTTRRALKPMMRHRFGRIVNMSSVLAARSLAGGASYSASKAALESLTRATAIEVARRGITVNAVAPGLVHTAMTDGRSFAGEDVLKRVVPSRQAVPVAAIADAVHFLTSTAAAHITGITLPVDGGLSAVAFSR